MTTKRKTKVVKSVKEDGCINAFYTETTRSKPYSYSKHIETDTKYFVGRFSQRDWRKLTVNRVLDFAAGYSPWVVLFLSLFIGALGVTLMSTFYYSVIIGLTGLLFCIAGLVGLFITTADFMQADFDESMMRSFIERVGWKPKRLASEVKVDKFVRVDGKTLVNHMSKVSQTEFLEIVQSFVKWDKAEKAYRKLDDTIGYSYEYDDKKLYDFMSEKRRELGEKISKNKAEAKELEKALGEDFRDRSLVMALQEAENAIAA